jgi:hypothetical protein
MGARALQLHGFKIKSWKGSGIPPENFVQFLLFGSAQFIFPAGAPVSPDRKKDGSGTEKKDSKRRSPEDQGFGAKDWFQENELAITFDQEGLDSLTAIAGGDALTHEVAQILRKRRVGFVDRLILANHAAQFAEKITCAGFLRGIG